MSEREREGEIDGSGVEVICAIRALPLDAPGLYKIDDSCDE